MAKNLSFDIKTINKYTNAVFVTCNAGNSLLAGMFRRRANHSTGSLPMVAAAGAKAEAFGPDALGVPAPHGAMAPA
jgi:hypothetical protein